MKIRIGVGLGAQGAQDADSFGSVVDHLERYGFDSLWLSEVLSTPALDPLVGLAVAAGLVRRLKLGTTMVLPGRNPVRLAKELATLDRLSRGRLLVTAVPGLYEPVEEQALGVSRAQRGSWIDEALPLLRRLWTEDAVDHEGPRFQYQAMSVRPRPLQSPLEVWLGGTAPAALRRAGRLADGWLPSLCTPAEAEAGRAVVEAAAAEVGRAIDPEHFGVSVAYARGELPASLVSSMARRRPGLEPTELAPVGLPSLRATLERFISVGFSKFVVRPAATPGDWPAELADLADQVLRLQT